MNLTEQEKELVNITYQNNFRLIRTNYEKELAQITATYPTNSHGYYIDSLIHYAQEDVALFIHTYIQVYNKQNKYPDQQTIHEIFDEINIKAKHYVDKFERGYSSAVSPIPKELLEGIKEEMLNELRQICSEALLPLRQFQTEKKLENESKSEIKKTISEGV